MNQAEHAAQMTQRFRDLVEESGDTLPTQHYDQLRLIIEAGLDTSLVEAMDKVTDKLTKIAHEIKNEVSFFD
ncbi:MAG: hypothetical protein V3W04_05960 [Gammaproteobacteria bacterium]